MSFKLRNTLILLFTAMVVIAITVWRLLFFFPDKIESLRSQLKQVEESVVQIPGLKASLQKTRELIYTREEVLSSLDKTVEVDVTMADAFAYLDQIQDRYGAINFTLTYNGQKESKGFGSRSFTLSGESVYGTIFSLVWALERGPNLFVIDGLNMRGVEASPQQVDGASLVIPFEMKVQALYANVTGLPPIKRTLADVRVPRRRNLFYPLISKNLPPNTRGLVEVERAELRAILPNRAIVADHTGKVRILSEGDEVYLGYLTKVDLADNFAEFTLNKGGIVERFRLKLLFTSEEGESR
ncbi:MAG: hypothetical protein V2A56_09560 [bacterium]